MTHIDPHSDDRLGAGLSTNPETGVVPPLSATGWLRWLWRQLTSMRTALLLLFLLALAAVPGSVFPQQGVNPIKVSTWVAAHPGIGPFMQRMGVFDVYASPWFASVYLLLFISLIGCVVPRMRLHWRAATSAPPAAPRNLSRMQNFTSLESQEEPQKVLDTAKARLKGARWKVIDGTDASGSWISAEKGYLRETGNLIFHLSLILILVAVAVGGLFGWKGNVIVKTGNGFSDTLTQYDVWGGGRFVNPAHLPPFSFALADFQVQFDRAVSDRGSPQLFRATVNYRTDPRAPLQTSIVQVNEPLSVDGAKVYLVGHGYAPHFIIKDAHGHQIYNDAVVTLPQDGNFTSTGVIKLPDASPQLGFDVVFYPTWIPTSITSAFPAPDNPAVYLDVWRGDTGMNSGVPQSVYTLDKSHMVLLGRHPSLIPGQTWTLPKGAGTITFAGWQRWASFQIAYDPGKNIALAAAVIALLGLMSSLFVRRRRIWVKALAGPQGTTVEVAGLNRVEGADMTADVEYVVHHLSPDAPGTDVTKRNS